jgi:uncharacterized protein YbaA (DUF1428 family)
MAYIDGCVLAVPTANKDKYDAYAAKADALLIEFGATRVVETWSDDIPDGKQTDFKRAVLAKDDEHIVFSFIEWPDKATRDAGWEKLMKDPRMDPASNSMPFDGSRLIYGGFQPTLDLKGKG